VVVPIEFVGIVKVEAIVMLDTELEGTIYDYRIGKKLKTVVGVDVKL
jgi:hypothetical protein